MKRYLIVFFCCILFQFKGVSQYIGIGQSAPSATLHITPINSADQPLRIDGLQPATVIDSSFVSFNPVTGVMKSISLSEMQLLLNFSGPASYMQGTGISISGGTINNIGDLDSTNEFNTSFTINGNIISLTDGGGSMSVSLPASANEDHDWYKGGTTSFSTSILDDIYTEGLVGIGIVDPINPLHVSGMPTDAVIGTQEILSLSRPTTNGVSFSQAATFKLGRHSVPGTGLNSQTRLDLDLKQNEPNSDYSTDKNVMTWLNNGYVGVGTSAPQYELDVNGNIFTNADFIGRLQIEDTRGSNQGPNTYDNEVLFEFKDRSSIGVPGSGTNSGMLTIAPWNDNSGNNHHQLNFNDGGLFWRQGLPNSASWGAWTEIITTSNFGSYGGVVDTDGDTRIQVEETSDEDRIRFDTKGAERVVIDEFGYIGIGTSSPDDMLHLNSASGEEGVNGIFIQDPNSISDFGGRVYYDDRGGINALKLGVVDFGIETGFIALDRESGNVGIGIEDPINILQVHGSPAEAIVGTQEMITLSRATANGVSFGQAATFKLGRHAVPGVGFLPETRLDLDLKQNSNSSYDTDKNVMTWLNNGNVGIGTVSPSEKLQVSGNVLATSFIATTSGLGSYKYNTVNNMAVPDYVFEKYYNSVSKVNPEYTMNSLLEVEKFIEKYHHLPRVPSRDDILKEGAINIQAMQMVTLEKVEELFIYSISLKKENIALIDKVADQEYKFNKQIESLNHQIEELKKLILDNRR